MTVVVEVLPRIPTASEVGDCAQRSGRGRPRALCRGEMNFLLLLSALLSALTGASTGVRSVTPAATVVERTMAPREAGRTAASPQRPIVRASRIADAVHARVALTAQPRFEAPLYMLRRRE